MEGLVDKGLVKAIGLSNFNARQTDDIIRMAKHKPVINQVKCDFLIGPSKSFHRVLLIIVNVYFRNTLDNCLIVCVIVPQVECHPYLSQADLLSHCRSVPSQFNM